MDYILLKRISEKTNIGEKTFLLWCMFVSVIDVPKNKIKEKKIFMELNFQNNSDANYKEIVDYNGAPDVGSLDGEEAKDSFGNPVSLGSGGDD